MADIKFSQFTAGGNVRVGDITVGLRSGDNAKFTFPGTGIDDGSGNLLLGYASSGVSAANYVFFSSADTSFAPSITAAGSDINVSLDLAGKGTGSVNLNGVSVDSLNNITNITSASFPGSASGTAILEAQAAAGTPTALLPNMSGTLALVSQIPGGGGVFWSVIAGTSQTATVNSGWIPQNVGLTTITLPSTAPVGSMVAVQGQGSGQWIIQAPGAQVIRIGASFSSAGGTVSSADRYDAMTLVCIVDNAEWALYGPVTSGYTIT